jgi:hypothetical protein
LAADALLCPAVIFAINAKTKYLLIPAGALTVVNLARWRFRNCVRDNACTILMGVNDRLPSRTQRN